MAAEPSVAKNQGRQHDDNIYPHTIKVRHLGEEFIIFLVGEYDCINMPNYNTLSKFTVVKAFISK
jgi:hypothetical protein